MDDHRYQVERHGFEFRDFGNGHQCAINGKTRVDFWLSGKKKSIFVNGHTYKGCTIVDVINLCINPPEPREKKRYTKGKSQSTSDPKTTYPTHHEPLYSGDIPPWDEKCLDL